MLNPFFHNHDSLSFPLAPLPQAEVHRFALHDAHVGIPVPQQDTPPAENVDLSPTSLLVCKLIGGKESSKLLRVLFDSGGTKTMIHRRILPVGATVTKSAKPESHHDVLFFYA